MSEIEIRGATDADRDGVEALLRACDLPPDGLDEQFGDAYAVAEEDGRIVGAAGMEVYGQSGLLRSVAVHPELRERGVAERLVRERLAWAERRGLRGIYLLTTSAAAWFPRLGFVPVERDAVPAEVRASLQFAAICPSTATVMALAPAAALAEVGG